MLNVLLGFRRPGTDRRLVGGDRGFRFLLCGVVGHADVSLAVVGDLRLAAEDVAGDHGPLNVLAQLDLGLVLAEFAAAHEERAAGGFDGGSPLLLAVPLGEGAVAETDRPFARHTGDLAARSPERAVGEADASRVGLGHLDHGRIGALEGDELAVGDQEAVRGTLLDENGGCAGVGAQTQKVAVAFAGLGPDELVADVVAEAEGIEHVLPVAAAEDKGLAVLELPLEELGFRAPPGVEVDVFDPSDVVDGVDQDAAPQRLAVDVADQVPLVPRGVDAVEGIEQLHLQHGRVLAAHGDGPGIGLRDVVLILLRIVEDHALERAVGVQRDEGGSVLAAGALGDQKGGAVVGGFGLAAVADAVVGGDRLPDAGQRHPARDAEVAGKEVGAAGGLHGPAAGLGRRVECRLESGRVVDLAVALGAVVSHVEHAGLVTAQCAGEAGQRKENHQNKGRQVVGRLDHRGGLAWCDGCGGGGMQIAVQYDTLFLHAFLTTVCHCLTQGKQ